MEKRRPQRRGHVGSLKACASTERDMNSATSAGPRPARRHQLTTRISKSSGVKQCGSFWMQAACLVRKFARSTAIFVWRSWTTPSNAALSLAQVATQCGDRVGLLAYGRAVQHNVAAGRGPQHLRIIVDSLALVRGEASEADHSRAARVLLTAQNRRSLVVWITDFAETPTTPGSHRICVANAKRHLVVFATVSQPDMAVVAETIPRNPEEIYRHAAALEIAHRRDLLLRELQAAVAFLHSNWCRVLLPLRL